jgi:uncharacterized protein (DUF488 family)
MTTSKPKPVIYSVGHSNHQPEVFIELLKTHGITTVVDVRSQPYSRWVPQANRETLARTLEEAGLNYVFMGDVLGGRPTDPTLYDASGVPDYDRVALTLHFQAGLNQLLDLTQTSVIVMMCSEGDYRFCHRTLLITRQLLELDARVIHIRPDGTTIEARQEPKQLSLF